MDPPSVSLFTFLNFIRMKLIGGLIIIHNKFFTLVAKKFLKSLYRFFLYENTAGLLVLQSLFSSDSI